MKKLGLGISSCGVISALLIPFTIYLMLTFSQSSSWIIHLAYIQLAMYSFALGVLALLVGPLLWYQKTSQQSSFQQLIKNSPTAQLQCAAFGLGLAGLTLALYWVLIH